MEHENGGTDQINYRASEELGLQNEVEEFKANHSREYAITLAKRLILELGKGEQDADFRRACEDFLAFCITSLNYGRDLEAHEIAEGKVSPAKALHDLRAALKEAFPVESVQVSLATDVAEITAK